MHLKLQPSVVRIVRPCLRRFNVFEKVIVRSPSLLAQRAPQLATEEMGLCSLYLQSLI
jgi:hypothetical protein